MPQMTKAKRCMYIPAISSVVNREIQLLWGDRDDEDMRVYMEQAER